MASFVDLPVLEAVMVVQIRRACQQPNLHMNEATTEACTTEGHLCVSSLLIQQYTPSPCFSKVGGVHCFPAAGL